MGSAARGMSSYVFDAEERLVGFYACSNTLQDDRLLDRTSRLRRHSIGRYFPVLEIQYVGVQKEFQRRGIGSLIMGRIVASFRDAADTLGIPVMTLVALNDRAAALYSRFGFVSYGDPGSRRMPLPATTALKLPPAGTRA